MPGTATDPEGYADARPRRATGWTASKTHGGIALGSELGDLKRRSDTLLADLARLVALEEAKREVPVGDPRLVDLAREVETVAERVLAGSTHQRELTEELHATTPDGAGPASRRWARSIQAILEEWRAVERGLEATEPGSPDAIALEERVEVLREEYPRAYEAARKS